MRKTITWLATLMLSLGMLPAARDGGGCRGPEGFLIRPGPLGR
jgi:hypothetical protein